MHRQFIIFVAASAVLLFVILANDRAGFVPQLLLGGTTAAFLIYFARRSSVDGRQIACAVVIATLGEIVLSLGWKLYSYQHAVIPFYVPPGHGVFYLLAAETALQPRIQRWARPVTLFVMIAGWPVVRLAAPARPDQIPAGRLRRRACSHHERDDPDPFRSANRGDSDVDRYVRSNG